MRDEPAFTSPLFPLTDKKLPRLEDLRVTDVLDAVVSEARMMGEKAAGDMARKLAHVVFGGRVDVKLRDLLKGRYG